MSCTNKVEPFPYLFCQGCMFNGCYPWNNNPLLLCSRLGGILPGMMVTEMDDTPRQCLDFKAVTEEMWQTHLADLKKDAEWKEKLRLDAIDREVFTDQVLPEHRHKVKKNV